MKKSKKWTRVERFERLWLVLSALLRKKIFISPENGKNLLLSRENKKNKDFGKRRRKFPHSILPLSFYTKKLNKMSSSMSASSAALGSKLALHKVRIFARRFLDVLYSRSREKVSRFHSLKGVKFFFLPLFLVLSLRRRGGSRFSKARAAIKTRVNAHKRESLSAQKINRVSFVLLVLGSAVLRECNRSFFAIIERRKEIRALRERWFSQSRRHFLGKREIRFLRKTYIF